MKLAFVDTEFTGEHAAATLVWLAVVGTGDEVLDLTFTDYDRAQVTPWLRENVLARIDESRSVSRPEGYRLTSQWFQEYSAGERIVLVSAGKLLDIMLLFELWHYGHEEWPYFHHLHGLPEYLNHPVHLDLFTVFLLAGIDPTVDREAFVGHCVPGRRHEALYDARVVKECFFRVATTANFPNLKDLGLNEASTWAKR